MQECSHFDVIEPGTAEPRVGISCPTVVKREDGFLMIIGTAREWGYETLRLLSKTKEEDPVKEFW